MKIADRILLSIIPPLAYLFIKLVGLTMRITYLGLDTTRKVLREQGNAMIAFWHNRILGTTYNYFKLFRDRKIISLISRSKDGEYAVRIQGMFGAEAVRGSSQRVNVDAMKRIVREIKAGKNCAITPDGPRGPKYKVQDGAVVIARLAGVPIVPVSYDCTRKIVLRSWDNFIVPLPFGRMVFIFGNPIDTSNGSTKKSVDALRTSLENELMRITTYAEKRVAEMKGGKSEK